jgi:hypothetical protein
MSPNPKLKTRVVTDSILGNQLRFPPRFPKLVNILERQECHTPGDNTNRHSMGVTRQRQDNFAFLCG